MASNSVLRLPPSQRGELRAFLRKRSFPASAPRPMRIIQLLDQGVTCREITGKLGAPASTISRRRRRYHQDGMPGLATIHPGRPPYKLTPEFRARVLARTRQAPPGGATHGSLRKMAAVMKVGKNLIARIWREAGLMPHRLQRYTPSTDPQFEQKAAAIIASP